MALREADGFGFYASGLRFGEGCTAVSLLGARVRRVRRSLVQIAKPTAGRTASRQDQIRGFRFYGALCARGTKCLIA